MPGAEDRVLIGVVDSGVSASTPVVAARAFRGHTDDLVIGPADPDALGHATETLRLVHAAAPDARLAVAQVFFRSMTSTPETVAAAVRWLIGLRVQVINLSLGTTRDSAALRESCRDALAVGCLLVASVPARGPIVYPAAYDGVLRVTGDARCAPGQFSYHATARVDFGACPHAGDDPSAPSRFAGASIAAARITGALGTLLKSGVAGQDAIARLSAGCTIVGPQTGPVARLPRTARR